LPAKALKLADAELLLAAAELASVEVVSYAELLPMNDGRIVPPMDAPVVMKYSLSLNRLNGNFCSI